MKLMLTCEEASTLLSDKMGASLYPVKRLLLKTQLIMCKKCTAVKDQMIVLRKVFLGLEDATSKDEIKMPDSSINRIKKELREQ